MTVWDEIYRNYRNGGPAWATIKEGLHPDFTEFITRTDFAVKNVLDIGCGDGKYLLFLSKLGFRITGIDSSPAAVSMATEAAANTGCFVVAEMYDYQYETNAYDLVISHAALHHGRKAKVTALLEKIYHVLTTKGKIFISLPDDDCRKTWGMMAGHETLSDGTCIPVIGPEKGLPHSFFSRQEIGQLFSHKYSSLSIKKDDSGRWIITGEKHRHQS